MRHVCGSFCLITNFCKVGKKKTNKKNNMVIYHLLTDINVRFYRINDFFVAVVDIFLSACILAILDQLRKTLIQKIVSIGMFFYLDSCVEKKLHHWREPLIVFDAICHCITR